MSRQRAPEQQLFRVPSLVKVAVTPWLLHIKQVEELGQGLLWWAIVLQGFGRAGPNKKSTIYNYLCYNQVNE